VAAERREVLAGERGLLLPGTGVDRQQQLQVVVADGQAVDVEDARRGLLADRWSPGSSVSDKRE
jgi:hypothetical protein